MGFPIENEGDCSHPRGRPCTKLVGFSCKAILKRKYLTANKILEGKKKKNTRKSSVTIRRDSEERVEEEVEDNPLLCIRPMVVSLLPFAFLRISGKGSLGFFMVVEFQS